MVLICEPECIGINHSDTNNGFLSLFNKVFSDIIFIAEKSHIVLLKKSVHKKNIQYIDWAIPDVSLPDYQRKKTDTEFIERLFNYCTEEKILNLIFLSCSSSKLYSIKKISKNNPQIKVYILMHGILEQLTVPRPSFNPRHYLSDIRNLLNLPYWFGFPLLFFNTNRIKYLLLSENNRENLVRKYPKLKPFIDVIGLPYNFYPDYKYKPFKKGKVRFGIFGYTHKGKGGDLLFKIAREIRDVHNIDNAEFVLIGSIYGNDIETNDYVKIISKDKPLSRNDFDKYAKEIDYAIYFYPSYSYQLTTSGAFFDAISYQKPLIVFKNNFFKQYFKLAGDIGYMCNDYQEMFETVKNISQNLPVKEYNAQKNNIKKIREMLSIDALADKAKKVFYKQL